ncbi:ribonuclease H1-like [Mercenaria mercenaria]|uniref:ribonuclease H1-like n=1 Tax=Mercenaria mercenaria TaxID=6596 RepID=UPI001E1D6FCB|nr:ribonuclease H1-like [Mercenaria mercenaria]
MFTARQSSRFVQYFKSFLVTSSMPFYAVRTGRIPGVYKTWDECKQQVDKFVKARYKKFNTEQEAQAFVKGFYNPTHNGQGVSSSTFKSSPTKNFSSGYHNGGNHLSNKSLSTDIQLNIAEKEIEYLKEKLKQKESEKKLLQTKAEIDQLKSQLQHKGKSPHVKHVLHKSKPYQHKTAVNSSNWKQNRTTQLIDLDEARQIHTATCSYGMGPNEEAPVVYTDGACTNNGYGEAKAGIGVYWGPGHPLNTSERLPGRQTNNRAEIHAVVKAVQQAKESGFNELTVKTDSMFLINSMTKWLHGWQKKDWKTAAGNPVINREDFECLLEAMDGVKINWVHVRGHRGIAGNEQADRLAVQGASKPLMF